MTCLLAYAWLVPAALKTLHGACPSVQCYIQAPGEHCWGKSNARAYAQHLAHLKLSPTIAKAAAAHRIRASIKGRIGAKNTLTSTLETMGRERLEGAHLRGKARGTLVPLEYEKPSAYWGDFSRRAEQHRGFQTHQIIYRLVDRPRPILRGW